MRLTIELDEGLVGEWFAKILELPGVVTYAASPTDASIQAQAMALRTVAEMFEKREVPAEPVIAFNRTFNELAETPQPLEGDEFPPRKATAPPFRRRASDRAGEIRETSSPEASEGSQTPPGT